MAPDSLDRLDEAVTHLAETVDKLAELISKQDDRIRALEIEQVKTKMVMDEIVGPVRDLITEAKTRKSGWKWTREVLMIVSTVVGTIIGLKSSGLLP